MKSTIQIAALDKDGREKLFKSNMQKSDECTKIVAKIIVIAEANGEIGKNGRNEYCQRVAGVELRESGCQGAYEMANVLTAIRGGTLAFSEAEFDKAGKFPLIRLSSLMSKYPDKVHDALEIIRSKKDVTNRIKALFPSKETPVVTTPVVTEGETKTPESQAKPKGKSKDPANPGAGQTPAAEVSEIQTPEAPKGDTYFVPEGMAILSLAEIQARILADIRNAATSADCENTQEFFAAMIKEIHARWETLEMEAENSAKASKAA